MSRNSSRTVDEEDSDDGNPNDPKKLDYRLATTASEIFRANYMKNRTIQPARRQKQWIPASHEFWF